MSLSFFFFNDPAPTEIYPLSLHDALPICARPSPAASPPRRGAAAPSPRSAQAPSARDRKSTRLNSSHLVISYAVFCLKKKNKVSLPQSQHTNVSIVRATPSVHGLRGTVRF